MGRKDHGNFEDGEGLWESVTSEINPLRSVRYSGATEKSPSGSNLTSSRRIAGRNATEVAAKKSETSAKAKPIDLRDGDHAGLDRATRRKLTKGNLSVDARIDLHGYNAQQAETRLCGFILQSADLGYRCVLVITGKGVRGEGVLRRLVPLWLKQPPIDGTVLAISNATPKDGGTGAIYVMLRRTRVLK